MNTNKNKNLLSKVERAKKTALGKIICRVMGEETGAVMMEYVIVAVMIGAIVVVGAWLFGAQILNMFGIGGDSMIGHNDRAEQRSEDVRDNKTNVDQAQEEAAKRYIKSDKAHSNAGTDL